MKITELPKGLVALVHHVELSQAGWRDRALELAATCVLHEKGGTCAREELSALLADRLPGTLGRAEVERLLARLEREGTIMSVRSDRLKLSESTSTTLSQLLEDHDQLEARVRDKFSVVVGALPSSARIEWTTFERSFLTPLILELGARTYEFLSGEVTTLSTSGGFVKFLTTIPEENRAAASQAIETFFNPKDPDIRAYLLRLLNAVFLAQVTGLPEAVLDALAARTKKKLRLRVFLDTNFLFSLIGLHENPADDVVELLNRLIAELKARLEVRLYILPITHDEARRTIGNYADRLSGLRLDRRLAEAVRRGTSDLSGITLRYVKEAASARRSVTAQEYFQPYLENLLAIARSKGVELYNESVDSLRRDQTVIDDVVAQLEFEKRTKGEQDAKSYELLLHDMVLWHFVQRNRPARLDSYLDADTWVATIDFGFLGFDRHKLRRQNVSVPACLHPTVLLQILQLWIPRSDLLDAALVDSLRPLVPHVFDRDAEQVTIRILRALSRFEDIGDLDQETLTHVLFDRAIRSRVAATHDIEEQIELVRDTLVAETMRLERKAKQLELEAAGLRSEVQSRDRELEQLRTEIATSREARDQKIAELKDLLSIEQQNRTALAERLASMEADRTEEKRRSTKRAAWLRLLVAATLGAMAFAGGAYLLTDYWVVAKGYPTWVRRIAGVALAGGASLAWLELCARRLAPLADEWFVAWLTRTRRVWWAIMGGVLVGVFASAIWDAVKN